MTLQIGIVFPKEIERKRIASLQTRINALRDDQAAHFESLLRSWRIFRSWYPLTMISKAIQRTLRDRP